MTRFSEEPGPHPMEKIGKYEVIRKIGQGGFGVVFEGRDPFIKRRVAIKTCSTEDEEIRKRFFREAEIAGNLQHRHVVTVFDLGVQDGVPYLVQEYLPGEDLSHKIKRRDPLSDYTKLTYLVEVAEGLEYAHTQGVVHRDIKPANIRILDDDSVKIMDFGIAKLASAETQLTHTGMAMGTAGYLPPEQIRGEKVDLRADIFSYGVMSYELLTGQRPFVADNMSAVLFQIIGQEPAPMSTLWPECPPALERLVKKSLAKNPSERYASFTPLLADLRPLREQVRGRAAPVARAPDTPTQVIPNAQTAVELETLRGLEKRLRDAVEKGDLTAAELELTLARKRHGDSPTFSVVMDPLMARIAEIRKAWDEQRQRSEQLSGLVERARTLREEGSLDEARIALTAALDLDSKNQEVQALLRAVDEAIEKKQYEAREKEGARVAGAQVEQLLRDGHVERAEEALAEAFRRHGEREPLPGARRLLQQKKLERRDAQVKDRLTRAQALEQAQRPAEAQEILREALQIHPENHEVKKFLARVTAAVQKQVDAERKGRNVTAAVAAVEELMSASDLRAAASLISRHERELGIEPFRALRQRLKEEERQSRETTVQVPVAPPTAVQRPPAPPPAASRPPAAPKAGSSLGLWAGVGGVVALLVVGGGAYLALRGRGEAPAVEASPSAPTPTPALPSPTIASTTSPTPAAPGAGVLTVDALPWAEVVEIADASGKKWPLPQARFTPLSLTLPAGEYKVTLRDPNTGPARTQMARVRAAASEPLLVELRRVDALEYLRKAGF
jgi:tRNA A-37 threonylcarbamoyl transferase component Bud32/tetratricopeptide (TPR) repeat protein